MESNSNALDTSQERDLNSFRSDIRLKRNDIRMILNSTFNQICCNDLEKRCIGMRNLYNLSKNSRVTLTRKDFSLFSFFVLIHFYIHQIHDENPDLETLNCAIYLLQFPQIVDVDYNNGITNFYQIQNPYQTTQRVQSLAQPDSIRFLLQGIQNLFLSESCFSLLTMIIRNKNEKYNVLNDNFFEFILENTDLPYGELFYLYFTQFFSRNLNSQSRIQTINQVLMNSMDSSNENNVLYMLKSMNFIFTDEGKVERYSSYFQNPYQLLMERLPDFILSDNSRIIVQCMIFVSSLDEIPDSILKAIFICLPSKFEKMHDYAFLIVANNLSRIVDLVAVEDIAEIIQNCFQSSQMAVKSYTYELFYKINEIVPLIDYINIESLLFFLDDPSLASTALPLIFSVALQYEKSGKNAELSEALSDSIEQINELMESENEDVAEIANKLNALYESLSEN